VPRHSPLPPSPWERNLTPNGAQSSQCHFPSRSVFGLRSRLWQENFHIFPCVVLLICLVGGLPVRGEAQTIGKSLEDQLAEGVRLLDEGHPLESVEVFNRAKEGAPKDPRPYFYCGTAFAQAGRMRDAAAELGEAVHLAPDQLDYKVFQAHVLEQLKQTSLAEETLAVFQDGRAAEQLSPPWLRLLADVYYRLQLTDRALQALDLWAKQDPTDARVDLYRGQVYGIKGQPDLALASFKKSLEKSTQNPQAYYEMGAILYEKNDLQSARDALLNAVREDEKNPEYRSKLASTYLAMGDAEAAIDTLNKVEAAGPNIPMIYYVLARAYRTRGDTARSAAYMEKFQQATNAARDSQAHNLKAERPIAQAQRQLDDGHPEAARALFQKALEVDPNRWEPNASLAEMELNSGNLAGAFPYLQKLEKIDPESAIGNFLIARYWFGKKDYSQARAYAEKVKLSRPDNTELRALLGEIYVGLGEPQKARLEYQEAVRLAPDRADLRERLRRVTADDPHPNDN
jgi:tetratricopeptide (TPR) repeat protein